MQEQVDLGIDGFPLDPAVDGTYYQRELDSWLARNNPNATPPAMNLQDSARLLPWLRALVTRLDWLVRHEELLHDQGVQWRVMIVSRMSIVCNRLRLWNLVPDEQLLLDISSLIRRETNLRQYGLSDYFALVAAHGLTPPLCESLQSAMTFLPPDSPTGNPLHSRFAWRLFVNEQNPVDAYPCWSASVRREILSLAPAHSKRWLDLLRLAPFSASEVNEKWKGKANKAIAKIGAGEVSNHITRWLKPFYETNPITLEFTGETLLRLLVEIAPLLDSPAVLEAITWPARATWATPRSLDFFKYLAPRYITNLLAQPQTRSALHTLAAQPYAAAVPEIGQAVAALQPLPTSFQSTAIDGYSLDPNDPLYTAHGNIDRLLQSRSSTWDTDIQGAIRMVMPDPGMEQQIEPALRQRIAWLEKHMPDQMTDTSAWSKVYGWQSLLYRVHSELLRSGITLDIPQIVSVLKQGTFAGFERAAAFTKEHGYRPEIVAAVREFHKTLHGTTADMTMRRQVGWWLWLDDATPIDDEECFTSVIRRDLRTMPAKKKEQWLAVLSNMTFALGQKMPAKWAKPAKKALDALGAKEFYTRIQQWFTIFQSAKPLNASTPGTDVFRCLIWDYSLLPADPATDAAFASIGQAKWKNKPARERLLKTTPSLADLLVDRNPQLAWQALDGLITNQVIWAGSKEHQIYTDLSERLARSTHTPRTAQKPAPTPSPSDPATFLRMLTKRMPHWQNVSVADDHVLVTGQLDQYRIDFDGRITRRNGVTVHINRDALPENVVNIWQPAIDAHDLNQGMFSVNLFQILFAVGVLSDDNQWAQIIQ